MVKIVYCIRRLPSLSREEFQRHWLDVHGPLLKTHAQAMGVRRVVQVVTLEDGLNAAMRSWVGGSEPYDGIVELWADSIDTLITNLTGETGRQAASELIEDTRRFMDLPNSSMWVAKDQVLLEA